MVSEINQYLLTFHFNTNLDQEWKQKNHGTKMQKFQVPSTTYQLLEQGNIHRDSVIPKAPVRSPLGIRSLSMKRGYSQIRIIIFFAC